MSTGDLDQLASNAANRFHEHFGRNPKWIVAAPGRVNLIGEHVDYNDGFVLPMAIDRYCVIAAAVATRGSGVANVTGERCVATIFSTGINDASAISLAAPTRHSRPGHWSNYIAGVLAGCNNHGMQSPPFDALIDSTVPVGGGLSSSAAIEVATATLIEAMTGVTFEPSMKALLCQKAEHEFAGVPCGIMDMFASTMARADHFMLLDCRSHHIEHIPFIDSNVTVLIMNSNVKHELSGGEYAKRRRQCESAAEKLGVTALRDITADQLEANRNKLNSIEFNRARHVVNEIDRTVTAAAAIRAGEWPTVGQLMYASHDSLRDDFEVSCEELDLLVNLAHDIGPKAGVIGSRMTGGGFGGCTVSLIETKHVDSVSHTLSQAYQAQTGIEPTPIISRPAHGAHVINLNA